MHSGNTKAEVDRALCSYKHVLVCHWKVRNAHYSTLTLRSVCLNVVQNIVLLCLRKKRSLLPRRSYCNAANKVCTDSADEAFEPSISRNIAAAAIARGKA